MLTPRAPAAAMPDVAFDAPGLHDNHLDWVGMEGIAMPLRWGAGEAALTIPGKVDLFINLHHAGSRGIHMSRLYLLLQQWLQGTEPSPGGLRGLLQAMIDSQPDIADRARIVLRFDLPLQRPALVSANAGWKNYPLVLSAELGARGFEAWLQFECAYSSTCPASAALSRQLIADAFARRFAAADGLRPQEVIDWLRGEQGMTATPHAQRSLAMVQARLADDSAAWPVVALIDAVEDALQTPVQTAVKREDEQAFALRNGQNLMFCEDAARRIQSRLDGDARVADFRVRVAHLESLHAHDAVAVASKPRRG
jgi:GTP cyclohydrolase I